MRQVAVSRRGHFRPSPVLSMFSFSLLVVFLFALAAPPAPAMAHAYLIRSDPGANTLVFWPQATADTEGGAMQFWFTEAIEPRFSFIEVRDAANSRIDVKGSLQLENEGAVATLLVKPQSLGRYTVNYRILSAVDGHINKEGYSFILGEASPGPGSILGSSPQELSFRVPNDIGAHRITVTILQQDRTLFSQSAPFRQEKPAAVATFTTPEMSPGEFEVRWEAATDQGRKFGQYTFTVTGG